MALLIISSIPWTGRSRRSGASEVRFDTPCLVGFIADHNIQNARRIIGQRQGWIDRLEQALKSAAVLPVTAAAMPGTSVLYGRDRAALPSRAQHHLTLAAARLTAFANGGKYSKG